MDYFVQQYEAVRLLAAAARQLTGDIRTVRAHYRRKPCPIPVKNLALELLRLLQTALQLIAAAQHASQEALAQPRSSHKPDPRPSAKPKTAARATRPAAKPSRKSTGK